MGSGVSFCSTSPADATTSRSRRRIRNADLVSRSSSGTGSPLDFLGVDEVGTLHSNSTAASSLKSGQSAGSFETHHTRNLNTNSNTSRSQSHTPTAPVDRSQFTHVQPPKMFTDDDEGETLRQFSIPPDAVDDGSPASPSSAVSLHEELPEHQSLLYTAPPALMNIGMPSVIELSGSGNPAPPAPPPLGAVQNSVSDLTSTGTGTPAVSPDDSMVASGLQSIVMLAREASVVKRRQEKPYTPRGLSGSGSGSDIFSHSPTGSPPDPSITMPPPQRPTEELEYVRVAHTSHTHQLGGYRKSSVVPSDNDDDDAEDEESERILESSLIGVRRINSAKVGSAKPPPLPRSNTQPYKGKTMVSPQHLVSNPLSNCEEEYDDANAIIAENRDHAMHDLRNVSAEMGDPSSQNNSKSISAVNSRSSSIGKFSLDSGEVVDFDTLNIQTSNREQLPGAISDSK